MRGDRSRETDRYVDSIANMVADCNENVEQHQAQHWQKYAHRLWLACLGALSESQDHWNVIKRI